MGSGIIRYVFSKDHCTHGLEKKCVERGKTGRMVAHREEMVVLVQRRDDVARTGVVAMGMEKKRQLSEPVKVSPSTVWWQIQSLWGG